MRNDVEVVPGFFGRFGRTFDFQRFINHQSVWSISNIAACAAKLNGGQLLLAKHFRYHNVGSIDTRQDAGLLSRNDRPHTSLLVYQATDQDI
jgi:hypothetical protein